MIEKALSDLPHYLNQFADYPALLFFLIVLATFVLEDPTTLATGLLLGKGIISWPFAISSLALGIFLGDLGLYFLGAGVRRGLFKKKSFERINFQPNNFDIIIARFIPGLRTVTFSAAGFFIFPIKNFLILILPSAVVWTLLLLFASSWITQRLEGSGSWVWPLGGLGIMGLIHFWRRK